MISYDHEIWCRQGLITEEDCVQFRIDEAYIISKFLERQQDVDPKPGQVWMIDHWENYNYVDDNCYKCGAHYIKHYTNQCLCGKCFCKYHSTWQAVGQFETNKRFKASQLAYKNRNKPIQQTINF